MITVEQLTKRHGARAVASDVTFRCEPGTVTGFSAPTVPEIAPARASAASTQPRRSCGAPPPRGPPRGAPLVVVVLPRVGAGTTRMPLASGSQSAASIVKRRDSVSPTKGTITVHGGVRSST
jgi:hypothetical protein